MAFLKVFEGGEERTAFLGESSLVVGRGDDADIFIRDIKASRRHCVVEPGGATGWRVRDLQSGNGTRVNDEPISERDLRPDDVIQIGDVRLLFAGEAVSVVERPAVPAPPNEPARSEPPPRRAKRRSSNAPWIAGAGVLGVAVILILATQTGKQDRVRAATAEENSYLAVLRAPSDEARIELARDYLARHGDTKNATKVRGMADEARRRLQRGHLSSDALKGIEDRLEGLDPPAALVELREMLSKAPPDEREAIHRVIAQREAEVQKQQQSLFGVLEAEFDKLVGENQYARAKQIWFFLSGDWPEIPQRFKLRIVASLQRMETGAAAERGALLENVARSEAAHDFPRAQEILETSLPRFLGTSFYESLEQRLDHVVRARREGVEGRPTRAPTAVNVNTEREIGRILLACERREFAGAAKELRALAGKVTDKRAKTEIAVRAVECEAAAALFGAVKEALAQGKLPKKQLGAKGRLYRVLGVGPDGLSVRHKRKEETLAWPQVPSDLFVALLATSVETMSAGPLGLAVVAHATGRPDLLVSALETAYGHEDAHAAIDRFLAARVRHEPLPEGGYVVYEGELITKREMVRRVEEAKISEFQVVLKKSADKIRGHKLFKRLKKMIERKNTLDEARDHALVLIYDIKQYFYPYRRTGRMAEYNKVQAAVDDRIKPVRELWEDPAKISLKAPSDLQRELKKFEEAAAELEKRLVDVSRTRDEIAWLRSYLGKSFNIRNFYRDAKEKDLLEYGAEVMADNAKLQGDIGDTEREQVRVTNEYRMMFGRWPVRLVQPLVLSSRGHCEEMARIGYFSHFSPTAGRKTPGERMRLQGYKYGISENIISGRTSPAAAHHGWCHSSGHHRNLLMAAWTEMGTGHHGRLMCQNFGQAPRWSARWEKDSASAGGLDLDDGTDDESDDEEEDLEGEDLEFGDEEEDG